MHLQSWLSQSPLDAGTAELSLERRNQGLVLFVVTDWNSVMYSALTVGQGLSLMCEAICSRSGASAQFNDAHSTGEVLTIYTKGHVFSLLLPLYDTDDYGANAS